MAGITEAQEVSEKKRLKRLVISQVDLLHAKRYTELILSRDWRDSEDDADKYLLHALNTALIVTYWRPFSDNDGKNLDDECSKKEHKKPDTLPKLEEKHRKDFSQDEKELHKGIGKRRNRIMAHSDSTAHSVRISIDDFAGNKVAMPIAWNVHVPLAKDDVQMLLGMIEKLIARISEDQVRIQALLPAGAQF